MIGAFACLLDGLQRRIMTEPMNPVGLTQCQYADKAKGDADGNSGDKGQDQQPSLGDGKTSQGDGQGDEEAEERVDDVVYGRICCAKGSGEVNGKEQDAGHQQGEGNGQLLLSHGWLPCCLTLELRGAETGKA